MKQLFSVSYRCQKHVLGLDAVASVVKSPTMIMVTRLCGRVLSVSERALRLVLKFITPCLVAEMSKVHLREPL